MWPSLATANHIADLANIFFIGSLVVGVISTVMIVWMANVKEGHWERARQDSEERIAVLATQGDEAKAALGTAQADIAKANAQIAEANARAVEAKLALEKFKAPRVLTDAQAVRVGAKLKQFGSEPVDLFLYSESAENVRLIGPISFAVNTSGRATRIWHVFGGAFFGVLVQVRKDAPENVRRAGEALLNALKAEGIFTNRQTDFSIEDWPQNTAGPQTPALSERAPIRVLVGNKPI